MGRPSLYSDELAAEICERITFSDFGIEQVCEADDMPCARSVFYWLEQHDEFLQQYARAKERQGEIQAARGVRDALTCSDPQIGRVRFDARRWHAGKLNPKVYGDKYVAEHTGAGGAPLMIITGVPDVEDDQLLIEGSCVPVNGPDAASNAEQPKSSQVKRRARQAQRAANTSEDLPMRQDDAGGVRPAAAGGVAPMERPPRLHVVGEVSPPDVHSGDNSQASSPTKAHRPRTGKWRAKPRPR